jgi:hypothetical protein
LTSAKLILKAPSTRSFDQPLMDLLLKFRYIVS